MRSEERPGGNALRFFILVIIKAREESKVVAF